MDTYQIDHFLRTLWATYSAAIVLSLLKIAAIVGAYIIMNRFVLQLASRLLRAPLMNAMGDMRGARVRALHSMIKSAVSFVLGFIAIIMALQVCGFNIVPLLTTASVAGLAIGFGAQKLVKDVISGFFILVEDQYGVGDYVTIGAASGVVEELGMRTTRLKDNSGKLFIISNGDINQVYNHSRGNISIWTDVPLSVEADLDKAKIALNALGQAIAEEMPEKVKMPFKCEGLSAIGCEKITIRFAGGVVALYQDEVLLTLNERICDELAKNNIELG